MGIEPFLVAGSVNLICAQRLVRRVCAHCAQPQPMSAEALVHLGFSEEHASRVIPLAGRGCESCNDTGYRGRIGLFEVMEITGRLREMIVVRASARELRQQATEDGMLSLRQNGLRQIAAGVSTVEEVTRETAR